MASNATRSAIALAIVALVAPVLAATAASAGQRTGAGGFRERLLREGRVSGVVRPDSMSRLAGGALPLSTCSAPGGTNYMADCASQGWPTNEMAIASNGQMFVAGANDYNSYNGHAQLGYYWSANGTTWNDAGPLDLYPHDPDNGAGDPGLAIDPAGIVYYSNIFFSYTDPNVGGVELARRDPATGAWSVYQIAADTDSTFQDKVAQFKLGAAAKGPQQILDVPGSSNSQGSAMTGDGHNGFWITWEEGQSIKLAHWLRGVWSSARTISPVGFRDLPSPLPGYRFRTDSFPSIALVNGSPYVVWASDDTGVGRTYLYANGSVSAVSDAGGDQFFASIGASALGYAVSWSQTGGNKSYDQYMWFAGRVTRISTARSKPNKDCRFDPRGSFIGDYNATFMDGPTPMPIWTDMRRHSQACAGRAQGAMVYRP
jgi:hypothetical protein